MTNPRTDTFRALPSWWVIGMLASVLSCSGGSGGGDSSALCGAPPGEWQYLSSCDWTSAGLLHECEDTFASPSIASYLGPLQSTLCSSMNGKLLAGRCPTDNSLGACIISASSGSNLGELQRLYQYRALNLTVQSAQASCRQANGTFIPPAGAPVDAGTSAGSSMCTTSAGAPNGAASQKIAFSVATVSNGEVVSCTNFEGAVTAAQLQSVLAIGATATACPTLHAACACKGAAGTGTFGTTPTLVHYDTTLSGHPGSACTGATCTTGYEPS